MALVPASKQRKCAAQAPAAASTVRSGAKLESMYEIMNADKTYKSPSKDVSYPNFARCNIKIPFQMTVCGRTGAGKTNSLLSIIREMNCFQEFHICTKLPDEPLYAYLRAKIEPVEKKLKTKVLHFYTSVTDMPPAESFSAADYTANHTQRLFIFDDQALEKQKTQDVIGTYWGYGRKVGISAVYITQKFYKCPIFVRENSSYVLLKQMNSKQDIKSILSSNGSLGADSASLLRMYTDATRDEQDFFLIDLKTRDPALTYRQNL